MLWASGTPSCLAGPPHRQVRGAQLVQTSSAARASLLRGAGHSGQGTGILKDLLSVMAASSSYLPYAVVLSAGLAL